jgi:hypothetical protein
MPHATAATKVAIRAPAHAAAATAAAPAGLVVVTRSTDTTRTGTAAVDPVVLLMRQLCRLDVAAQVEIESKV